MNLDKSIQYIKGVGEARAKVMNTLGIFTLKDLITYYPRTYEDRSIPKKIDELVDGEDALIEVMPVTRVSEVRIRRNMTILKMNVRDDTGVCQITWFNQSYLKSMFKPGEYYKFYGKVSKKGNRVEMNSPVYDKGEDVKNTGRIIPIYPSTYKMPQTTLRRIIENGLKEVDRSLDETLPDYIRNDYNLCDINTATYQIHFPTSFDDFQIARKRLAEAIVLTYIELQKNKQFANMQVFSPECQMELNKFDEYMDSIKQYQLKANGEKEERKDEIKYPISLYVDKMIKLKKKQSEVQGIKKKKKISPKTVTYYWRTAKTKVLPIFGDMDATTITQEQIQVILYNIK